MLYRIALVVFLIVICPVQSFSTVYFHYDAEDRAAGLPVPSNDDDGNGSKHFTKRAWKHE